MEKTIESAVRQRVLDFIHYKRMTQREFEKRCGMSNGYINQIKKGIGNDKLNNIINAFPDLNIYWLLYGDGEMLKQIEQHNSISHVTNSGNIMMSNNVFGNSTQINGANATHNDAAEEVEAEVIPYIDTALARKRNFNIAKAINNDSELLKQRTLDELFSPISFLIKMADNSMTDEIRQGDMLFAKFIPKEANIVSGKIYLIDTNSYGTLVRQVYVNEDSFTLHAFNPSYEDIIITRDDIFNFCIVEHSLRSSFLIPDNTISTIAAESAKQVTKVLSMLEKANERNDKQADRLDAERAKRDELVDLILNNNKK